MNNLVHKRQRHTTVSRGSVWDMKTAGAHATDGHGASLLSLNSQLRGSGNARTHGQRPTHFEEAPRAIIEILDCRPNPNPLTAL